MRRKWPDMRGAEARLRRVIRSLYQLLLRIEEGTYVGCATGLLAALKFGEQSPKSMYHQWHYSHSIAQSRELRRQKVSWSKEMRKISRNCWEYDSHDGLWSWKISDAKNRADAPSKSETPCCFHKIPQRASHSLLCFLSRFHICRLPY